MAKFEKVSNKQFNQDMIKLLGTDNESYSNIVIPKRATSGSAGYDFTSPVDFVLKPGEIIKVPTGIRCRIDEGYVLEIYPRSSIGFKYQTMLANTVGIIDSDYYYADNEGHIIIALMNMGKKELDIKAGERFAQGIFKQYFLADEEDVVSKRTGGFGSTS
ncbi:MAG: dUTP diphosphatase [Erysipelotrichaceae bacterium]